MRIRVPFLLSMICLLGLSMPVWAGTFSIRTTINQPTKLVNIELKPGQYRFVADESSGEVKVEHHYKVIATVKGQWVKLDKAADYTAVLMNNHTITGIDFAGKNKAIKF
jgi:hypothetical protein